MAYEGFAPYPSPVDQADRELVEKIVSKIKSQGIFDQFRQDCLADVDTKPAYKHLQERVNGSVSAFLKKNRWKSDLNKTQLRESLRHHVQQGYFHAGVDRIVDQVVNAKIYSVFVPKVEDMVYETLGIEKPKKPEKVKKIVNPPVTKAASPVTTAKKEEKPEEKSPETPVEKQEVQNAESLKKDVENSSEKTEGEPSVDLLPTDLDPVSPASVVADDDRDDSDTIDETPFLLATIKSKDIPEASNASKLSGMSDLSSHGTVQEISSTTNSLKIPSKPILPKLDNFSNLSEKLKQFDPLSKATVPDKAKPISEDETSSASNLNESESNGKDSNVEFDRNLISEDSKSSISDFKKFKDKTEDQVDDNKTKNDSKPEENPEDKKVQKENTQNSENDDKNKKESSKKSSEKKSESRSRHDSDRKDSKSSSSRSRSSRKDEKSRDKSKDDKYKSRDDRHRSERKSESDKKDDSSKSDKKDERKSESDKKDDSSKSDKKDERKSSSKYKEKRSDDKKEERKKDEKKREDKRRDDEKKKDEDKKRDDKRREDDKKRDEKRRDEKRRDEDKKRDDYKRRDDDKKKDDDKRRDDDKKKDDDKRRDDDKKKDDDKRRDDEKRESRKRRGERCSEKSKEWRHSSDRDNSGGQSGKKPSSHSDRRSSSEKNPTKSGDQKSNGEGPQDSEISEVDMVLMKINSSIDLALKKPKIAKNIHEARKIDKQRHSLEEKKENRKEKPEKNDVQIIEKSEKNEVQNIEKSVKNEVQNIEKLEKNEVQNTEETKPSDQNEFNTGTCSVRLERIDYQEQNYDTDKNETEEVDEIKYENCETNPPVCEDKVDEFHGFDSEQVEKFDKEMERKFNIRKIKKEELYKSFFSVESTKTIKTGSDYELDTNLNIKPSSLRKRKNSQECTQTEKKQRRRTRNSRSLEDEESENECCDSVDASSMTVMLDNLLKETDSSIINKNDDDNVTTNQKTRLKSKNVEKAEPATEVACSVSNEKRSKVRNSTRTLQQRYDNSDLYKPKTIGFSSRRSRALSDSSSKTDNVAPERKRAR